MNDNWTMIVSSELLQVAFLKYVLETGFLSCSVICHYASGEVICPHPSPVMNYFISPGLFGCGTLFLEMLSDGLVK